MHQCFASIIQLLLVSLSGLLLVFYGKNASSVIHKCNDQGRVSKATVQKIIERYSEHPIKHSLLFLWCFNKLGSDWQKLCIHNKLQGFSKRLYQTGWVEPKCHCYIMQLAVKRAVFFLFFFFMIICTFCFFFSQSFHWIVFLFLKFQYICLFLWLSVTLLTVAPLFQVKARPSHELFLYLIEWEVVLWSTVMLPLGCWCTYWRIWGSGKVGYRFVSWHVL